MTGQDPDRRYCGRPFAAKEIQRIRELIAADLSRNRAQLSRLVCDELGWLRPDGRLKDMSCRVAMLRMARDGLITLPPPRTGNGNGRNRPRLTPNSDSRALLDLPAVKFAEITIRPVADKDESSLWNQFIERYHYLGYKPLVGAQVRYLAFWRSDPVAALGFGAAAWALTSRDRFIGWNAADRARNLSRVVNNSRFLILPWVRSRNLASRLLGLVTRRISGDWESRYGYTPVLLETFVEMGRFGGTCYRAANWIVVGKTQGRGKVDRQHWHTLPVKEVLLYPLVRDFRRRLCSSQ